MINFKKKFFCYSRLIRLDKPIGTLLLLWPTLQALWIASHGIPSFKLLFIFIFGTFLMRSAGCAMNDFADYRFDGQVSRTARRPLITGEVSRKEAFGIFLFLSFLSFLLVLLTNKLTILLSFAALLVAIVYPFMKRVTHYPQLVLSIAFAWGVPMAFAATLGAIPPVAWLLFLATTLWIVVYDTFYAMVDREDDLKVGVKSTAVLWGQHIKIVTGILQIMTVILWVSIGMVLNFKGLDYVGILAASGLFIFQQIQIRNTDPGACFKAFLNNHWVGFCVFLSFLIHFQVA